MILAALEVGSIAWLAVGLALGALVVGLWARKDAATLRSEIDELKHRAAPPRDARADEPDPALTTLRKQVAALARGEKVDADQVLEGRAWRDVSPAEALALVASGSVRLLDVRTPQETALGVIPGARIVAVQELESRWREIEKRGKPLLVYCAGGARSAAACEFLAQQGFDGLMNLDGGFQSWSGPRAKPD